MSESMDKFGFYSMLFDEKPGTVYVNLSLVDRLQAGQTSQFVGCLITMNEPNSQGLTSNAEWETRERITEAMSHLAKRQNVEFIGCVATDGQWQYLFYCGQRQLLIDALHSTISEFPKYQLEIIYQYDPTYQIYLKHFFPSETKTRHQVLNFEIIQSLLTQKINLIFPHTITHKIQLPEKCEELLSLAQAKYQHRCTLLEPGKHMLEIDFISAVNLETLNAQLFELVDAFETRGASYLGCGISYDQPEYLTK